MISEQVDQRLLEKCAWGRIDKTSLIVHFNGSIGLADPGYIVSDMPAVLLQLDGEWAGQEHTLLNWFKSSFFIWYCAVHRGTVSAFQELSFPPFRLPIPRRESEGFLEQMRGLSLSMISAETNFMLDIHRMFKKGNLTPSYQEKTRISHNSVGDRVGLSIDKEVFEFLDLSLADSRFVTQTMRDINLTDFGYLDESEALAED